MARKGGSFWRVGPAIIGIAAQPVKIAQPRDDSTTVGGVRDVGKAGLAETSYSITKVQLQSG